MRRQRFAAAAVALPITALFAACERAGDRGAAASEQDVLQQRVERLEAALAKGDSSNGLTRPVARWLLPAELAEVSGLALTPDQRLFAHNDETARISEVDYRRGVITKSFAAGETNLRADFEALTFARDHFFMLTSNGLLYEFPEGEQNERVDCTVHDTGLGKECEFEGLTYDAGRNAFILSCKSVGGAESKQDLVLYRYHLSATGSEQVSRLVVPRAEAVGRNAWKQFRPTDITIDPSTGNYVLVSAQEKALVAVTPDGKVVETGPLGGVHPQAEGVAITRDRILIVSDEATNTAATITLYRWH